MKPKNKKQKYILSLSHRLTKLSESQEKWAYENCLAHIGRKMKKGIRCLECGAEFKDYTHEYSGNNSCICPGCGRTLFIEESRQRVFHQQEFLCWITVCKDYQVLRFFEVKGDFKLGQTPYYSCHEIVQRWIEPNGNFTTVALLRCNPMGYYFSKSWNYYSGFEIRNNHPVYNIEPTCYYPVRRYIPEVKRNGFSGDFMGFTPFDLFQFILSDNRAETLIKAGQKSLLQYAFARNIERYWNSVKICLRNGYVVQDAQIWTDYIDLLEGFGKDTRNAKYVCPENLSREHDRYVEKRRIQHERERIDSLRKQAVDAEKRYKESKGKFFGIVFGDDMIKIHVLDSVHEFMQEGDILKHCVFSNEYYDRSSSLILSARIDGKPVETIEFSLKSLQVVQCRGILNKNTEYHDRILNLVKKNVREIRKRITA